MAIKLNSDNFFRHYILRPLSKDLSKADRTKAPVSTIALALLFFIPQIVACFLKYTPEPEFNGNNALYGQRISVRRKPNAPIDPEPDVVLEQPAEAVREPIYVKAGNMVVNLDMINRVKEEADNFEPDTNSEIPDAEWEESNPNYY